jgi:cystathionine beta-lyase/cystathionine gamma-synthase
MTIGNTCIPAIRRTEETIVAPPATSSHVECTPEERARLGIPEGLIRSSTGIEDVEDLIVACCKRFVSGPERGIAYHQNMD